MRKKTKNEGKKQWKNEKKMWALGQADVFLTGKWTGCSGDTPLRREESVCVSLNKTDYGVV